MSQYFVGNENIVGEHSYPRSSLVSVTEVFEVLVNPVCSFIFTGRYSLNKKNEENLCGSVRNLDSRFWGLFQDRSFTENFLEPRQRT